MQTVNIKVHLLSTNLLACFEHL